MRNIYKDIFDSFKSFEIVKDFLKAVDFENKEEFNQDQISAAIVSQLQEEKDFDPLLKQTEILILKRKFDAQTAVFLEDAKRRKEGFALYNMPLWFYALLLIFGFDDLIRILRSWMLVPILIGIGGMFLLKQFNYDFIIKDVYFMIEEILYKKVKSIKEFIDDKLREYKFK